ncbi:MAG TPA: hypothetical protein VMO26_28510 [Vicinamibacterales bacterium]|nr:hypothetical protein [Vicinamibacterales bacterium]
MRIRQLWLALAVLLFVPGMAHAHTHVWDVFFGSSYANASHLSGLHFVFAIAPAPAEHPLKKVSLVFDASFHRGTHGQDDPARRERPRLARTTTGVGLRVTPHGESDKHLTSFQFLYARVSDDIDNSDRPGKWGLATSLMYEYLLTDSEGEGWAFRAQGDVFLNKVDDFLRLSAGLAYHRK